MDSKTDLIIIETDLKIRKKTFISLWYQVNTFLGICEQLRFMYDDVYPMPDSALKTRLTERLIDLMIMGKKITGRLLWYQKKYKDTSGHHGTHLISLQNNSWRIRMRKGRNL